MQTKSHQISQIKSVSQYASILGVHSQTLRRYEREGKIPCFITLGNHRRFKLKNNAGDDKLKVGYARVSSSDQKEDLIRQKEDITIKSSPDIMISDIGSGLNYKKAGFRQ